MGNPFSKSLWQYVKDVSGGSNDRGRVSPSLFQNKPKCGGSTGNLFSKDLGPAHHQKSTQLFLLVTTFARLVPRLSRNASLLLAGSQACAQLVAVPGHPRVFGNGFSTMDTECAVLAATTIWRDQFAGAHHSTARCPKGLTSRRDGPSIVQSQKTGRLAVTSRSNDQVFCSEPRVQGAVQSYTVHSRIPKLRLAGVVCYTKCTTLTNFAPNGAQPTLWSKKGPLSMPGHIFPPTPAFHFGRPPFWMAPRGLHG